MRFLLSLIILAEAHAASQDIKVLNVPTFHTGQSSLRKRQNPLSVDLDDQINQYSIQLSIGTPAQIAKLSIAVDSGDTWVPGKNSAICKQQQDNCNGNGSFDPKASSTIKDVQNSNFSISYSGTEKIQGTYYSDVLDVGGSSIKDVQFAVGLTGSQLFLPLSGIIGLGYDSAEVPGQKYNSFISVLAARGITRTKAYSVWLNKPTAPNGNIIFGGIDTNKFTPPLAAYPMIPGSDGLFNDLRIQLTALSFSSDFDLFYFTPIDFIGNASINPGFTYSYLPDDMVKSILTAVRADKDGLIPCDLGNDPTAKFTFEFGIGDTKIDVLLKNMLFPNSTAVTATGQRACNLGIQPESKFKTGIHLGQSFMRSAYVIYDLTNNYIALAPAKLDPSSENIQEINSDGIPGAATKTSIAFFSGTQSFTLGAVPTFYFTKSGSTTATVSTDSSSPTRTSRTSQNSSPTATVTSTGPTPTSSGNAAPSLMKDRERVTLYGIFITLFLPWLCAAMA